jgi:hypothetical protein
MVRRSDKPQQRRHKPTGVLRGDRSTGGLQVVVAQGVDRGGEPTPRPSA